jgi:hypothetical protein
MKQIDDTLQKAVAVIVEASLRKKRLPRYTLGKGWANRSTIISQKSWPSGQPGFKTTPSAARFQVQTGFSTSISDSQLRPGEGRFF